MKQITIKNDYDVVIIGAGPAGLSFACSLAEKKIRTLIVERSSIDSISNPQPDGREIAITHQSRKILNELGVWSLIDEDEVSLLKEAKVYSGSSNSLLDFDAKKSSIEALGYLVPNYLIRKGLYERVLQANNIDIVSDISVEDINTNNAGAEVELSDGIKVKSRLVVAADSRFSEIRRKMGIPSLMKDFSKVMIVTRMEHEKSHNHVALECFNYGHTLALLPLNGNVSSVVLTVSTDNSKEMLSLSETKFNEMATEGFKQKLGQMKQIGERHSYPLIGVYAQKFKAKRFALVGDAAVGMHPVTAHGFNLGLKGQDQLSLAVKRAFDHGLDIGSDEVLNDYERKHINFSRLMYFGTNGIVALFTNDTFVAKQIRKLVLKFANRFPPVKSLITNHLTESKKSNLIPF
jgi:ubiquinone biosynthesis UbiH/UbiF/VisC/COQ6 family hydroxylase